MTISLNGKESLNETADVGFSVDLRVQAQKHLVFLRALHKLGITTQYLNEAELDEPIRHYAQRLRQQGISNDTIPFRFRGHDPSFCNESLRRYNKLWLPLVAKHQQASNHATAELIPPPDIAWMWHCHRLAPYRYAEHVQRCFGNDTTGKSLDEFILDPLHPFVFQLSTDNLLHSNETWQTERERVNYDALARKTREIFHDHYPSEPFFWNEKKANETKDKSKTSRMGGMGGTAFPAFRSQKLTTQRLLSGFDVLAACQRQATFLWQVSGANYSGDKHFASAAIANYLRFVQLVRDTQGSKPASTSTWLVPTYQIDWMWHTHILSGIRNYDRDVQRLTGGSILDHDDSLNDRTEGGILDTSFQQTCRIWKETYHRDYFVAGGMYRGEPPAEYYRMDFVSGSLDFATTIVSGVYIAPPDSTETYDDGETYFSDESYLGSPSGRSRNETSGGILGELCGVWGEFLDIKSSKYNDPSEEHIESNGWMPDHHDLAFKPCQSRFVQYNQRVPNYIFGVGDQGLGYYHIHTRQGVRVLIDRCQQSQGIFMRGLIAIMALIGVYCGLGVIFVMDPDHFIDYITFNLLLLASIFCASCTILLCQGTCGKIVGSVLVFASILIIPCIPIDTSYDMFVVLLTISLMFVGYAVYLCYQIFVLKRTKASAERLLLDEATTVEEGGRYALYDRDNGGGSIANANTLRRGMLTAAACGYQPTISRRGGGEGGSACGGGAHDYPISLSSNFGVGGACGGMVAF